ncbi:MAG: hypothetical protein PHY31_10135, partial [Smithellaceae bacterium]|nr:hypothetical protein [Smithellaceae bacterium]
TGKMVLPKYGLLSMIIQAFQEKAADDLALIPVYIGYDRIIEEKSYLKELGGAAKEKEKTTDVIKSSRILRKRYGRVYVNIAEPILLKSYLEQQPKSFEEMTIEERQSTYRKIGYDIVLEITKVSVVTPFALVASGLLCHNRRGIAGDELIDVLRVFYDYLAHRGVKFASTLSDLDKAVSEALNLFVQSRLISRIGMEEGDDEELTEIVYSLDDNKRLNIEYYKNNILHYFVPVSFVASSILAHTEDVISVGRIVEDYRFFKRIFHREFIFDDGVTETEEVEQVLSYLQERGMITGRTAESSSGEATIEVKGKGRTNLKPFAGLIHNYIESYWVVIRGSAYLRKAPIAEKDWTKKLLRLGELMFKKGEITRTEALSQANYQNAISVFSEAKVVVPKELGEKADKKERKAYGLTENKSQIESIRRRLFRFL